MDPACPPGFLPGPSAGPDETRRLHQLLAERAVHEIPEGFAVHQAGGGAVHDGPGRVGATDPAADARVAVPDRAAEDVGSLEPPAGPEWDRHLRYLRGLGQPEEGCRTE